MKIGIVTINVDYSWFVNLYCKLIKRLILKRAYKGYCEYLKRSNYFDITTLPTFVKYKKESDEVVSSHFNFYLHYFKKKTAFKTWKNIVSIKDILFS